MVKADRKVTVMHTLITHYNSGMQKTISEHTCQTSYVDRAAAVKSNKYLIKCVSILCISILYNNGPGLVSNLFVFPHSVPGSDQPERIPSAHDEHVCSVAATPTCHHLPCGHRVPAQ